jgi:hypothetical protein
MLYSLVRPGFRKRESEKFCPGTGRFIANDSSKDWQCVGKTLPMICENIGND